MGLGDLLQIFFQLKSHAMGISEEEKLTMNHQKLDSSDSDTKWTSLRRSLLGLKL